MSVEFIKVHYTERLTDEGVCVWVASFPDYPDLAPIELDSLIGCQHLALSSVRAHTHNDTALLDAEMFPLSAQDFL